MLLRAFHPCLSERGRIGALIAISRSMDDCEAKAKVAFAIGLTLVHQCRNVEMAEAFFFDAFCIMNEDGEEDLMDKFD
jgi:hypothetical protein